MTTDTTKTEHEGPIAFERDGVTWRLLTGPTLGREFTDARPGDVIAALSANPQLRAAVLVPVLRGMCDSDFDEYLGVLPTPTPSAQERALATAHARLRAAESALAAAHLKNSDLSYQLGKAQGEAEGHALARKGLEAELAEAKVRRDDDLAIMGQKLIDAQESHSKLFAQLEAARASAYDWDDRDQKRAAPVAEELPAELPYEQWQAANPEAFLLFNLAHGWGAGNLWEAVKANQAPVATALRRMRECASHYLDELRGEIDDHHYTEILHHAGHVWSEVNAMERLVRAQLSVLRGETSEPAAAPEAVPLTRAYVTAIVDARVAELARAAVARSPFAEPALEKLAEAAEAGKASG